MFNKARLQPALSLPRHFYRGRQLVLPSTTSKLWVRQASIKTNIKANPRLIF